jgi:hypothetical protein
MDFSNSSDEGLSVFYESVRRQVVADRTGRYRLMGASAKHYADRLSEEMDLRQLKFTPIEWPPA